VTIGRSTQAFPSTALFRINPKKEWAIDSRYLSCQFGNAGVSQEIEETATGKKFAIVQILAPTDKFQQVLIADRSNPKSGAILVSSDRLRRDFEFLSA